ncbi:MAG: FlgD immunoglobulin-like domain containing protein, partial [Candidatus Latescibacterota bacterium]
VPVSLLLVSAGGDTLESPLNDEDRTRPGIQRTLTVDGRFRLDQIPALPFQVFVKAATHLQGVVRGDTAQVGDSLRTFLGFQWVGSDSTVLEALPAGDATDDNRINLADFGLLVRYWGASVLGAGWPAARLADFDGSGRVDSEDLFLLADHFGEVGMTPAESAPAALGRAAQAARVEQVGDLLRVHGTGPLTAFSLLVLGPERVEVELAAGIWGPSEVLAFQWPEGQGVRLAAALRDPEHPVGGEGVLGILASRPGGPQPLVAEAELLHADGRISRHLLLGQGTRPAASALLAAFPNPANPGTVVPFVVGTAGGDRATVLLEIYDVLGQRVRTLAAEEMVPGPHQRAWDGQDASGRPAASGVYLYRLHIGGFVQTRRLLLLH